MLLMRSMGVEQSAAKQGSSIHTKTGRTRTSTSIRRHNISGQRIAPPPLCLGPEAEAEDRLLALHRAQRSFAT